MESLKDYGLCMRGEVVITDLHTNKVLFKGHNMIVQDGRNFVRDLFLSRNEGYIDVSQSTSLSEIPSIESVKMGGVLADSSAASMVAPNQTLLEDTGLTNPLEKYFYEIKKSESTSEKSYASAKYEGKFSNRIKITIKQNGAKDSIPVLINELGIFLSDGKMFSRITFDGIYLGSGEELSIDYYIYF